MKHGKKLLSVLLALVMVLALLPSAAFAAEGEKHITILGTSDMHGNIWGFPPVHLYPTGARREPEHHPHRRRG